MANAWARCHAKALALLRGPDADDSASSSNSAPLNVAREKRRLEAHVRRGEVGVEAQRDAQLQRREYEDRKRRRLTEKGCALSRVCWAPGAGVRLPGDPQLRAAVEDLRDSAADALPLSSRNTYSYRVVKLQEFIDAREGRTFAKEEYPSLAARNRGEYAVAPAVVAEELQREKTRDPERVVLRRQNQKRRPLRGVQRAAVRQCRRYDEAHGGLLVNIHRAEPRDLHDLRVVRHGTSRAKKSKNF